MNVVRSLASSCESALRDAKIAFTCCLNSREPPSGDARGSLIVVSGRRFRMPGAVYLLGDEARHAERAGMVAAGRDRGNVGA